MPDTMPLPFIPPTRDPEQAPAVPAAPAEPTQPPITSVIDQLDRAEERAAFWEKAYDTLDGITDDARFVQHARYKTALYVLGGCFVAVGVLLIALHLDMRKGRDQ